MKTILIATKNSHKVLEYRAMLEPLGYQVKTLFDFPDLPEIEETGDTFRANALIKAKTLHQITGLDVVADDSGLCVDALDGAPGVYSARFAGENVSYTDNNKKLLENMIGQPVRDAHFITVICLVEQANEPQYFDGRLFGTIATHNQGNHGFGYDPIFVLPDGRHLAELNMEEKNAISHRGRALHQLMLYLQENNR